MVINFFKYCIYWAFRLTHCQHSKRFGAGGLSIKCTALMHCTKTASRSRPALVLVFYKCTDSCTFVHFSAVVKGKQNFMSVKGLGAKKPHQVRLFGVNNVIVWYGFAALVLV